MLLLLMMRVCCSLQLRLVQRQIMEMQLLQLFDLQQKAL